MNTRFFVLTVFLLLVGATITLTPEHAEAQSRRGSLTEVHDGNVRYKWMNGEDLIEVRLKGDVAFTIDDAAVESMSRDGLLKIEEREGGMRRTLEVRPASDGTLRYTYEANGTKRAYDAATRDEVAELILIAIRNTGIGADRRVARILEQEGLDGVFDEIRYIDSGYAKRRYFIALLEQGNLDTAGLQRLAEEVTRQITSGGDRGRFLREAAPHYLEDSQTHAAYFDAVNTIPSSGDHARVLMHLLDEHDPDREALIKLLQSARRIESSGDKARVLKKATAHYDNHPDVRAAFFDAANSISSPGDQTRVLKALLDNADLDAASITALFQSAKDIASSGDKARLLIDAAPFFINDDAQRAAFFDAVNTISSPGDHARVLLSLLREQRLDKASLKALLASAGAINASGDKARVLIAAADRVTSDDDLVEAYLAAAETIAAPGDHSRALSALVKQ